MSNNKNILVTVMIFCGTATQVLGAQSAEWKRGKLHVTLPDGRTEKVLDRDEVFVVNPRCFAVGPGSAAICPCAACFAARNG